MRRYKLQSEEYRSLELIGQRIPGQSLTAQATAEGTDQKLEEACGWIRLRESGSPAGEYYFNFNGFEPCSFQLKQNCEYEVEIGNLEISLAYLCGQDRMPEEGVCFLEFGEDGLKSWKDSELDQAYGQEFRNRFHFAPFKNWMNDPNGLCRFKGYYHLFYQYNPNGFQWGNMHWGHGVSKDLIHWKHLPIAAYPQIELQDNAGFRGGAFSGSAVVVNDQLQLFYTRHFGKSDRSWHRQWQVTKASRDGIHFTQEEICVWGTPEGVCYDFRDPKVECLDGVWTMVLGGTVHHRPAVLRYTSEDLKNWEYQGVLLEEKNPLYGISECPDLFCLNGKYVLTAGFMYAHPQDAGKRRDTKYYIGQMEQGRFVTESEGIYDYGKDFYAVQSFQSEGRRIGIGWNCGLEAVWEEGSSNGTASIPRELTLEEGTLKMLPVKEFQSLLGPEIRCEIRENTFELPVPREYFLRLRNRKGMQLSVLLAGREEKELRIRVEGTCIFICSGDKEDTCIIEAREAVTELQILVDRSLIEVFANGGAYTCSRRYYISDNRGCIKGEISDAEEGLDLSLRPVRGIWGTGGEI